MEALQNLDATRGQYQAIVARCWRNDSVLRTGKYFNHFNIQKTLNLFFSLETETCKKLLLKLPKR